MKKSNTDFKDFILSNCETCPCKKACQDKIDAFDTHWIEACPKYFNYTHNIVIDLSYDNRTDEERKEYAKQVKAQIKKEKAEAAKKAKEVNP